MGGHGLRSSHICLSSFNATAPWGGGGISALSGSMVIGLARSSANASATDDNEAMKAGDVQSVGGQAMIPRGR